MALVAIVGRPNVGKSTLFNRMSGTRRALVDDIPGVTRDRNHARVSWEGRSFAVVDTAGFVAAEAGDFEESTRRQIDLALAEADVILFVTDAKAGLNPEEAALADLLRRTAKPVLYVVNKVDGVEQDALVADFYRLGVTELHAVSAAHGLGVADLLDAIVARLPGDPADHDAIDEDRVAVAVVGRPNVGKSTLVNALLRAPRVLVSDRPGTTRDAIDIPFEHAGHSYVLIDTAGIRRRGRTQEKLEKLSVLKALQSIDRSHVAVLVLDGEEGLTDQDLHIAGYIQERFRGCLVVVNKWDVVAQDPRRARTVLGDIRQRLRFMPHAPLLTISALEGKRVSRILPTVREIFREYAGRVATAAVNQVLTDAVARHEPPLVAGRRLKFYYATQASARPPTFVIFCNQPKAVHFSYERYLLNSFRGALGLRYAPLRLVFRPRRRGIPGD
jgi:GTP-binding protein